MIDSELGGRRAAMDVTLSELLAAFMESPLVMWVSGSRESDAHELLTPACYFLFPVLGAGAFVSRTNRLVTSC